MMASVVLAQESGLDSTKEREKEKERKHTSMEGVDSRSRGNDAHFLLDLDKAVTSRDTVISPVISEAFIYPKELEVSKKKPRRLLDNLPDNLTSEDAIRKMSLKPVEKIKSIAEREKKAKLSFEKKLQSKTSKGEKKSKVCTKKTKGKK